jgi:hypothetical protein
MFDLAQVGQIPRSLKLLALNHYGPTKQQPDDGRNISNPTAKSQKS